MPAPARHRPEDQFWFHASHHAGPFHITHKSYASAFSQGWHDHERGSIDFVLAGGGVGVYAHEEIRSGPGQLEYFAPEVRHRFRSGATGVRTLHISFPGHLPRELGIDPDFLASALASPASLAPVVAVLTEVLATPQPDLLLLESLAMRMLEDLAAEGNGSDPGASWVSDIRSLLIEEPDRAGSLGAIAEAVGRHPSHVSRAFRAAYGLTLGEFGRRLRLMRSAQRLASPRSPSLARVAAEFGFYDQAHYTNAFRAYAGCTPRRFAERLGSVPDPDSGSEPSGPPAEGPDPR